MIDIINSVFMLCGGVFSWFNVRRLYVDKKVLGYSPIAAAFFLLWALWNLYFYPAIDCDISFIGAIIIAIANIVWVWLMIYYRFLYKKKLERMRVNIYNDDIWGE